MALIPTKRELGPLAQVQQVPGFRPAQSFEGEALANVGQAVQRVGAVAFDIAQEQKRERDEAQRFATTQSINQLSVLADGDLTTAQQQSRPDGFGLQSRALADWQKRADAVLESTPAHLRDRVRPILETERLRFEQRAGAVELEKRNGWFRTGIGETFNTAQNRVFDDPAAYERERNSALASIRTSSLPDAEKAELETKLLNSLGVATFQRRLNDDQQDASQGLGARQTAGAANLVGAVIHQESRGNPNAVSPKGAAGLMQVMPATGAEIAGELGDTSFPVNGTVAEQQAYLKDPTVSERYGTFYLNKMLARYGGDQAAALIAYNGGPSRADAWLASGRDDSKIPKESANYYKEIMGNLGRAADVAGAVMPALRAPLDVARAFLGATANQDAGVISSFIEKATGQKVDPRQTAWCAHWLNGIFQSQGIQGTGSGLARSFLDFGTAVNEPEQGDVVVFERGGEDSIYGHVGIVAGVNEDGSLRVLGGNQGGKVSVATYGRDRVLGFRRPPNVSTPGKLAVENAKLPGGGASQGLEVGNLDPIYANIPFATRMQMLGQANQVQEGRQRTLNAEAKAAYDQQKGSLELSIVKGTVTEADVMNAGLRDDDTAQLVRSLRAADNDRTEANGGLASLLDGTMGPLNPRDTTDMGRLNKAYAAGLKALEGAPEEARQAFTVETIRQTQVIPQKVQATIEGGVLDVEDPAQLAANLSTASSIQDQVPAAFKQLDQGAQKAVADFRYQTLELGRSDEQAAQRIVAGRTTDAKQAEALYGPAADTAAKELKIADVTAAFDPGFLSTEPGAGGTVAEGNRLMREYQDAFRDAMLQTQGDATRAKAVAVATLKSTWDISNVSGSPQLMRLPPERFYPPIGGGFDYLRTDAMKTATDWLATGTAEGGKREPSNVFLRADAVTAKDIAAGRRASYVMAVEVPDRDGDGEPDIIVAPQRWALPDAELRSAQQAQRASATQAFQERDARIGDQRATRNEADDAARRALDETVGPDWMKARAADIAREQVLQGVAPSAGSVDATVQSVSPPAALAPIPRERSDRAQPAPSSPAAASIAQAGRARRPRPGGGAMIPNRDGGY